MKKINEIYICDRCNNICQILHETSGDLSCCGEEMRLLNENSIDAVIEKHIPIVEQDGVNVKIKVGEVEHPMLDNHHIEFIEVITNVNIYRKYLKFGQKPEASFTLQEDEVIQKVREYCNLHGLWRN